MNHRTHSIAARLLAVILFVASGLVSTLPAKAAPAISQAERLLGEYDQAPRCWPLDIVLMVDQSYSMFTDWPSNAPLADQNPASDPDGYRFEAATEILYQLIQNRKEECPNAVHRFGLITWGDTAKKIIHLAEIDLSSDASAENWSDQLRKQIRAAESDRTQNGTQPLLAFRAAQEMFDSAPAVDDAPELGPRRQVAVLLTDGNPDGMRSRKDYMCSLTDELNRSEWLDTSIWLMALNSRTLYLDEPGCSETMRADWESVINNPTRPNRGKILTFAYSDQTVPQYVAEIVNHEFGHPGTPIQCGEVFYVDPYVAQVKFTFFRSKDFPTSLVRLAALGETQDQVLFEVEAGQVLQDNENSAMVYRPESYKSLATKEEHVFDQPRAGRWIFSIPGLTTEQCQTRIVASEFPYQPVVTLVSPDPYNPFPVHTEAPYYDATAPIPVQLQLLTGEGGAVLPLNPDYPPQITALLTNSAGETIATLPLSPAPNNVWASENSLQFPVEGAYHLKITGTVRSGDRTKDYELLSAGYDLNAKQLSTISLGLEAPADGEVLPCNSIDNMQVVGAGIPVRVWLNRQGQAASPADVLLKDPTQALVAELIDQDGQTVLDTVNLLPDPTQPGLFSGELLHGQAGLTACHNVTVRVKTTDQFQIDSARFTMPVRMQQATITRLESKGVLAHLAAPTTATDVALHPTFKDACPNGQVAPLLVQLQLTDVITGDALLPEELTAGEVGALYQAKLTAPDGTQEEFLLHSGEGNILTAEVGQEMTAPGTYTLDLVPQVSAMRDGFVFADPEPVSVSFTRKDPFTTSPLACNLAIGSGSLLGLVAVGLLAFGVTGGPGGVVSFSKVDPSNFAISEPGSVKLKTRRWFGARIRRHDLKEYGIGEVYGVKDRAEVFDYDSGATKKVNTARVMIKDTQGAIIFDQPMERGQPYPLDGQVNIEYR